MMHESRLTVRYAETDAMGIVHHASYLVWFEVARTEWLAARGYSYAEFEQSGFFLLVAEANLRYLRPARYGDPICIRSEATQIRSRAVRFEYTVCHADSGEQLVTGFTRHILTDHAGRIRTWPEQMLALLATPPG